MEEWLASLFTGTSRRTQEVDRPHIQSVGAYDFFFLKVLCPMREILWPYLGTAAAGAARYPFQSVCAVFSCVQTTEQERVQRWYPMAASVSDFFTCAQLLRHTIAHGGCTDTVRESALKVE